MLRTNNTIFFQRIAQLDVTQKGTIQFSMKPRFFSASESQLKSAVLKNHWHQHRRVLFTHKYCNIKSNFIKGSHTRNSKDKACPSPNNLHRCDDILQIIVEKWKTPLLTGLLWCKMELATERLFQNVAILYVPPCLQDKH